MNYEFPIINNISDVLPAIEGRDEFTVAVKEGYTVINYNVMMADTFPAVIAADDLRANHDHYETENLHARLRRECRGIIFDTATGEIIRRPFHKFFNVNEKDETQEHVIDLSRSHAILEKLDGSMLCPFIVNDQMIWGTKMGATDVAKPVEEFVKNNPQYVAFSDHVIRFSKGWSPIFEWCSRKQRIVLDYKEDQLVLTALRNMNTGEYSTFRNLQKFGEEFDIPVVRAFEPQTDMKDFIDYVRGLEDIEGFVVRFADGHMTKLKCQWYVQIHKAKEAILQDRNIAELVLEDKLDDVKAHLPAEDRDRLTDFENDFNRAILIVTAQTMQLLYGIRDSGVDRKTFAIEQAQAIDGYTRPIIFKNFDSLHDTALGSKVDADIRNTIRNNLSRNPKYEAIRDLWFKDVVYNV